MITIEVYPGPHKTFVAALKKHDRPWNYIVHLASAKTEKAAKVEAKRILQALIKAL